MTAAVLVRSESEQDVTAIHAVEMAAFGREAEANLVDALRELNEDFISLVATDSERVLGHACFSRVPIDRNDGRFSALAPLAVASPPGNRSDAGECRTG